MPWFFHFGEPERTRYWCPDNSLPNEVEEFQRVQDLVVSIIGRLRRRLGPEGAMIFVRAYFVDHRGNAQRATKKVYICHENKELRTEATRLVKHHKSWTGSTFHVRYQLDCHSWDPALPVDSSAIDLASSEAGDANVEDGTYIYAYYGSRIGERLVAKDPAPPGNLGMATGGVVVDIDGTHYQLTSAHFLRKYMHVDGHGDGGEDDWEYQEDGANVTSKGSATPSRRPSFTSSSSPAKNEDLDPSEPLSASQDSHEKDTVLHPSSSVLQEEESQGRRGTSLIPFLCEVKGSVHKDDFVKATESLDYLLVRLTDKEGTSMTRESIEERNPRLNTIPSRFGISQIQELAKIPDRITSIIAVTASSGVVGGILHPTPALRFSLRGNFSQQIYTVELQTQMSIGDSGAIVFDQKTNKLYGHIILGYPGTPYGYIISAHEVFNDIKDKFSSNVKLAIPKEGGREQSQLLALRKYQEHLIFQAGLKRSPFSPESSMVYGASFMVVGTESSSQAQTAKPNTQQDIASTRSDPNAGITLLPEDVVASLFLPGMHDAEEQVGAPDPSTYLNVLRQKPYSDDKEDVGTFGKWLQAGSGIFWMGGPPGTGKSTLMKHLANSEIVHKYLKKWADEEPLLLGFAFLEDNGSCTKNSPEWLLRSILFDCLSRSPDRCRKIFPNRFKAQRSALSVLWTLEELRTGFKNLLSGLSGPVKICLFIDAIEESDENPFESLGLQANYTNLKLCISLRPWALRQYQTFLEQGHGVNMSAILDSDQLNQVLKDALYRNSNFINLLAQYPRVQFSTGYPSSRIEKDPLWTTFALQCIIQNPIHKVHIPDHTWKPSKRMRSPEPSWRYLGMRFTYKGMLIDSEPEGLFNLGPFHRYKPVIGNLDQAPGTFEDMLEYLLRNVETSDQTPVFQTLQLVMAAGGHCTLLQLALATTQIEEESSVESMNLTWPPGVLELCNSVAGFIRNRCQGFLQLSASGGGELETTHVSIHDKVKAFLTTRIEKIARGLHLDTGFLPETAMMQSALLQLEIAATDFGKKTNGAKCKIWYEVVQPRTLDFLSWARTAELRTGIARVELADRLESVIDKLCGIQHHLPFWNRISQKQEPRMTASPENNQKLVPEQQLSPGSHLKALLIEDLKPSAAQARDQDEEYAIMHRESGLEAINVDEALSSFYSLLLCSGLDGYIKSGILLSKTKSTTKEKPEGGILIPSIENRPKPRGIWHNLLVRPFRQRKPNTANTQSIHV